VGDLYHAVGRGKPWAVLEMNANDGNFATPEVAGPARGWLTSALVKHALSGAKFASLFRDAPSPSGIELFGPPGLRDEAGRPTETVQACAEARRIIDMLAPLLARPRRADVALVMDSDDLIFHEMWPVMGQRRRMSNDYPRELFEVHHQLCQRGYRPTFASLDHDLSAYQVVVLWNKLMIREGQAERLRQYVEQGGTLICGYMLGYLHHTGRRTGEPLPFRLMDVFGCTVRDLLTIGDGNAPRMEIDGQVIEAARYAVTLEPLGGDVLATWRGWTGEHTAAIVSNRYGKGRATYVGALLERSGWEILMPRLMAECGLVPTDPIGTHPRLEIFPERGCWIVCNEGHEAVRTTLAGTYRDFVTGEVLRETIEVDGFGLRVIEPI